MLRKSFEVLDVYFYPNGNLYDSLYQYSINVNTDSGKKTLAWMRQSGVNQSTVDFNESANTYFEQRIKEDVVNGSVRECNLDLLICQLIITKEDAKKNTLIKYFRLDKIESLLSA
jgi:hypothetical protein